MIAFAWFGIKNSMKIVNKNQNLDTVMQNWHNHFSKNNIRRQLINIMMPLKHFAGLLHELYVVQ
jgi:hypothetical protein